MNDAEAIGRLIRLSVITIAIAMLGVVAYALGSSHR